MAQQEDREKALRFLKASRELYKKIGLHASVQALNREIQTIEAAMAQVS
jgi:hypothetical protein